MTQAELDILNRQKSCVTHVLQEIVRNSHVMQHTLYSATVLRWKGKKREIHEDTRIRDYIESCALHPELHGIQEQLAVLRYIRMVLTYGFRPEVVKRFVFWAENTPQEGKSKRECYKVTEHEAFISAVIFGFWHVNTHGEDARLVRTVLLLVARKYNKTGFAALVMSFYFIVFGDDNGEYYFAANSAPQAKKGYNECKKQIHHYDPHCYDKNSKKQTIRATEDEITWKPRKGAPHRLIQRLSGNVDTKDGFNPQAAHIDEMHADRDLPSKPSGSLLNVLESGMGNRKDPLILITSTAGRYTEAILARMCDTYKDMLLLELACPLWQTYVEDLDAEAPDGYWQERDGGYATAQDVIFPMICQPDIGDDITAPETWRKAQPHLGITVYNEFYESCLAKAYTDHTFLLEFLWKNLNQFVKDESSAWFTLEQANALMDKDADFFAECAEMGDCVCAIDLMQSGDMCAVCYFGYNLAARRFRAHIDYYQPRDSIQSHPNRYLYEEWAEQGWLTLTPGKVIDTNQIVDDITRRGIQMQGRLQRIRYDAAFARDFANRMKTEGSTSPDCILPVPQTILNYNMALQYFDIIRDDPEMGGLVIDYNPIVAWNLTNCIILTNSNGLRMPDKGRGPTQKIDGADALLMCVFDAQERI